MRILVTGAAGMLGKDLQTALAPRHDVIPTDVTGDVERLDVTDTSRVLGAVRGHRPDLVIHAAAYTDVDGCEREPDKAFRVNAFGTWNIAAGCMECDAALLYISTDFVFDGMKAAPYTEYDAPNPVNCYGASKLAGEMHVRALCPRHYIVRTAWLYGAHGKNFPFAILSAANSGQELRVVADQVGTPTFTADLAAAIRDILEVPLFGTYHVTNKGSCSWYDFARRILSLSGMDGLTVQPIKSADWSSPARRPKYTVLRHYALELQGRDNLRPWEDALEDFLSASCAETVKRLY